MGNLGEPIVPTLVVSVHRECLASHKCGDSALVILLHQYAGLPLDFSALLPIIRSACEKGVHRTETRPSPLAFADAE